MSFPDRFNALLHRALVQLEGKEELNDFDREFVLKGVKAFEPEELPEPEDAIAASNEELKAFLDQKRSPKSRRKKNVETS